MARTANERLNMWITPVAKRLLSDLSEQTGITMTAVFEMAIRDFAAARGIDVAAITAELKEQKGDQDE